MVSDAETVGPIVFANETARRQLRERGEVVTFRSTERTTGETWWRESRTGPKRGECEVRHLLEVDPSDRMALDEWRPASGFETVDAWRDAIEAHHGGLDPGHLYLVTADVPVGLRLRTGSELKRIAADTGRVDDVHVVRCPGCDATWDDRRLYKTGSVLRCPACDGVMRP